MNESPVIRFQPDVAARLRKFAARHRLTLSAAGAVAVDVLLRLPEDEQLRAIPVVQPAAKPLFGGKRGGRPRKPVTV